MAENQLTKRKRGTKGSHNPPREEESRAFQRLREIMEANGFVPRQNHLEERNQLRRGKADSGPGQLIQREQFNLRPHEREAPVFNTYEEYQRTVFQSLQTITIMLDIHGIITFVSENVSDLLGYNSAEIMGSTLLNILPDEEKDGVAQKIILDLPLVHLVGKRIEFCCNLKKRTLNQDSRCAHEYVKFLLNLQDAYDESFVFFGNLGPNRRSLRSSGTKLLWEKQYYLVGTICVLSTQLFKGVCTAAAAEEDDDKDDSIAMEDSDEGSFVEYSSPEKRCCLDVKQEEICIKEEIFSDSSDDENIEEKSFKVQNVFELFMTHSDASSDTSISSTECRTPPSESNYEVDERLLASPVDLELVVDPKFLLDSASDYSSDGSVVGDEVQEDLEGDEPIDVKYHITIKSENQKHFVALEDKVDPQYQEEQTYEKYQSQLRQEAVVKPVVHFVTQPLILNHISSERPMLGERFTRFRNEQLKTHVFDLGVRSVCDTPPRFKPNKEYLQETEQRIQALSQRIEMLQDTENQQHMSLEEQNQEEERKSPPPAADDVSEPQQISSYPAEDSNYSQNDTYSLQENVMDRSSPQSEPSSLFGSPQSSEYSLLELPALEIQDNCMQLWENGISIIEAQHLIKTDTWLCTERDSSEDEPFGDEASPIYRPAETSHFMSIIPSDLEDFED